ncbi:hypothetical protein G9G63_25930 [Paenibacillus sp. EKM202P]|uniref:hypothetical protein n=1 Tax=unclassified Paenibacillus TaxID=185978 RepID=UPI0013EAABC5|nr:MULTISPECIES: hypothetical protein [unclassified Paenibacillus]KAF6558310.1 hypothetical protein G9G63_25930 [Paenibacillus sp. EKM202P]KAF6563242.1 hypothetical protein G9G64_25815 [Paenibacillus sp. EKM207P]
MILDEAFAGIDVLSREAIVAGIIDYLEGRQQSILISTHDIQEVEGLFDYTQYPFQSKKQRYQRKHHSTRGRRYRLILI